MRLGFGVALLLAATLPVTAVADNIVGVTVTGTLPDNSALSSTFTLDLSMSTNVGGGVYDFLDPAATVNGSPDTLNINVGPAFNGNTVELTDIPNGNATFDEFIDFANANGTLFFDATVPTFNPGTYSGSDIFCPVSAQAPAQRLPGTLAMIQTAALPCAFQLVASSVTPEPTSIALFATGLLGVGGIVRRRYLA